MHTIIHITVLKMIKYIVHLSGYYSCLVMNKASASLF